MYEFENFQNNVILGVVTPKLQVSWSRHRAWHKETVRILVRTELIKDGTKVKLEIKTKAGKTIDTLDKGTLSGNANNQDYKIEWKDKKLDPVTAEVVVTASIKDPALTADSEPLFVDVVPPVLSG